MVDTALTREEVLEKQIFHPKRDRDHRGTDPWPRVDAKGWFHFISEETQEVHLS